MTGFVDCRAVTHHYQRGGRRGILRRRRRGSTVTALQDVSVSIARDETLLLVGPSGSGKSTLLHLLAGLDRPSAGTITVGETEVSALSDRRLTRFRRDNVGIVFQDFRLIDALSARANVALPLVERGISKRRRREKATALLERVGLGDRLSHRPGELSGGERQRVAIARALVTDPVLVIADEPTGELDTDTGATVLDILAEVGSERAVVIASHDENTARIADRTLRLQDGRLQSEGP